VDLWQKQEQIHFLDFSFKSRNQTTTNPPIPIRSALLQVNRLIKQQQQQPWE